MKKLRAFAPALLLAIILFGCGKKAEPSPAPVPDPTYDPNRGETVITAAPTETPAATPMPTPEPMETFQPAPENPAQPTPEPLPQETPAPAETSAPGETPAPSEGADPIVVNPSVLAAGSFRSDTGTALNLIADWRIAALTDTAARITVTLSLESYSLDIGERRGNLLTFNGEDYYFMTDALEVTGGEFVKTQIYVWSKEIDMKELSFDLTVEWKLLGSYSKQDMETITLTGSYVYDGSVG